MGIIVESRSLIYRCGQCKSTSVEYVTRTQVHQTLSLIKCRSCGHERVLSVGPNTSTGASYPRDSNITYSTHPNPDADFYEDF